jgi:putative ABC transport system permease protein
VNLGLRDLTHNLGRFIVTCLGIGLLLGVVLGMIGIYRGLVDDSLALSRGAGADLWVVEDQRQGPFAEVSRMPRDIRDGIARISGVGEAGSVTYQSVQAIAGGLRLRLFVVGYEPGRLGGPPILIAGRPIEQSHYEIVLDQSAKLPLGAILRLGRHDFTVVGLTRRQVSAAGDAGAYITLHDGQILQFEMEPPAARNAVARGQPPADTNTINAVVARLEAGADANAVAGAIRRWKHLEVLTQGEQEALLSRAFIDKVRKQIGLFATLLVIVATVIIALIVYTMTLDKVREIATLKLIGAPDRVIVGMIVQQSLALGILGFIFGAAYVNVIAPYFPRRVVLLASDASALAGVTVLACLAASALAVRYALRVDPGRALAG